jgi:hypothetical protein
VSPGPGDALHPVIQRDLQGLRPALLRLDLQLRLAVQDLRADVAERASDPFSGLYVSDGEVDELLAHTPPSELAQQQLEESPLMPAARLAHLACLYELSPFEQDALMICLAPDADLRYERLYGYLQDDATRRRPTVDLVLRLLCESFEERTAHRALLGPGSRLVTSGLLSLADESTRGAPLLARALRVDERVAEFLLGSDEMDSRLASIAQLYRGGLATTTPLPADTQERLLTLLRTGPVPEAVTRGPVLYLQGAIGMGKSAILRALCVLAERPLLLVDVPALLADPHSAEALPLAAREAELQGAVLGLDAIDLLLASTPDRVSQQDQLREVLRTRQGPTVLLGALRWEPAAWAPESTALHVELPQPSPRARANQWLRHVNEEEISESEVTELAERYHLDDAALAAVAASARGRAAWEGRARPTYDDLRAAARAIATPPLEGLANRVEPRYAWDDIVLPSDGMTQLRDVCARARFQTTVLGRWGYGRKHVRRGGTTALFAGPPGTGKTMAAEIVSGDLGLDLYRIELSAVVSKYIGETEKNLEQIFHVADQGDAVLLFDEADAIFGKRSEVRDAHDRYANLEVSYLLQRLERYAGLAILTTNMRANIDEAFLRRLDCVIEFPVPEEPERLGIWRLALPAEAPVGADVDLAFLARKYKLAGGHIRNIALGAAFLAAAAGDSITMKYLVRATRREYQKLGKLVGEQDFEHYYPLLKEPDLVETGA